MLDYSRENSWTVDQLRLEYLGGSYRGRGRLSWEPDIGFHVDCFLDRRGTPLPNKIEFGRIRLPTASELGSLRMCLSGFSRAISPRFAPGDQLELISQSRLDVQFPSILFTRRLPKRTSAKRHFGSALFELGKGLLFSDDLVRETGLNERRIQTTFSKGGIDFKDDSASVYAWLESESQMRMEWYLSADNWSKTDAWNYAEGAETALSFLSGRTVRLLERTTRRGNLEYHQRLKRRELTKLGLMSLVPREHRHSDRIDREQFVRLSRFFTIGGAGAFVSRLIFAQMVEASRQQVRAARELLCSNVLDAALRTLVGKPYKPSDRTTKIEAGMEQFRAQYLTDAWKDACRDVLCAYHHLRHRNAHPDWLTGVGGGLSGVALKKRFDDIIRLTWFYGYMVFALAGFEDLEPKFPTPHEDWGPLLTQTTGTSTKQEKKPSEDESEGGADSTP